MSPRFGAAGQGPAYSLAFVRLQDRALIARGGSDGVIRLIDIPSGEIRHEIEAHRGAVRALTPLPDVRDGRRRLASCGVDCVVRVWDLDTFARTNEVRLANPKQDHAQLSHATIAGRALIAVTVGAEVQLWDPDAHQDPVQLAQPTDQIWSLATTMVDGQVRIAGGGNDGRIYLWDPAGGERLVSGSADSTIRLWDPRAGTLAADPFQDYRGEVWALAPVEIDGHWQIMAGGAEGSLLLLDPQTRHGETVLAGSTGTVWALSIVTVDDAVLLASGGVEGAIRITDIATDTDVRTLTGHRSTVRALAAVPAVGTAAALIASGGADGTVRLWDARLGGEVGKFQRQHVGEVWSLAA